MNSTNVQTIAVFGGRFDPVHNGHVAVAKEVLRAKVADEVWFSLENQHQWRPIVASITDRKNMLKLALEGEKKFRIDETPILLGGLTETISVVRLLRQKVPYNIVFVAGSDQLHNFHTWTHWEELEKELQFLIVVRKGSPVENLPQNCIVLNDPNYIPLEDSATRIRELRKEGKSISGLVSKKVEEYIIEHGLYK